MSAPVVEPRPGESLDGLLMRTAAELGQSSTLELVRLAGGRYANRPIHGAGSDDLGRLAEAIGLDVAELAARSYPPADGIDDHRLFNGVPVATRQIEKRTRRFCPATLVGRPWHRAAWQLRLLPFCEETWSVVTDACHSCGAVQGWKSAWGPEHCDRCVARLEEGSTAVVPDEHRDDLRWAGGLLHHDPDRRTASLLALPTAVREHGAKTAVALLSALTVLIDPPLRSPKARHLVAARADPLTVVRAAAGAWRLLSGWPQAPIALMDARLGRRPGRFGDGNGGATSAFLTLGSSGRVECGSRSAIDELRNAIGARQERAVPLGEFMTIARRGRRSVLDARREGLLPCVLGLRDGRPHPLYLPEDAAGPMRARTNQLMRSAAERMGCTFRGVEELLESGALEHHFLDDATGRGWPSAEVATRGVAKLEERLRSVGSADRKDLDLPLHLAVRGIGGRLTPWSALFNALLGGTIPFRLEAGSLPTTKRIMVRRSDLPAILATASSFDDLDPRFETGMSLKDAAATLNAKEGCANATLARWPGDNSRGRPVPIAELVVLARRLVFPAEVGILIGSSAAGGARRLRSAGLRQNADGAFDRASALRVIAEFAANIGDRAAPLVVQPVDR